MIKRTIKIGRWVVDFLFAKLDYDEEGVLACLYEIGADEDVIRAAYKIMDSEKLNCGFTFANPDIKHALVVVGPASSGKQFCNTTGHELYHLVRAISKDLGIDLDDESPAYLSGDLYGELIGVICKFGCDKCHHKNFQ